MPEHRPLLSEGSVNKLLKNPMIAGRRWFFPTDTQVPGGTADSLWALCF